MSDYAQVLEYLTRYSDDYRDLLDQVMTAARGAAKHLGPTVVANVYTRPDGGMGPFKDPRKIAAKLRKAGIHGATAFLDLNDVIGVTVVVQYPDQLEAVGEAVRCRLRKGVRMGSPETHENKGGYFAHHEVCSRRYGPDTLKCEVQLKTMLHDAWAKKMHDLTYKPSGKLDRRLAALMQAGSVTIESVERQSVLIRNLIQANWNVEKTARRHARECVFQQMLEYSSKLWEDSDEAAEVQQLHEEIEAATAWLPDEPAESEKLQALMDRIGDCCGRPEVVRFGWMLAGRLASIRPDARTVRSCARHTDEWLKVAPALIADGSIEPREILAVPLMFYLMNELDLSIDYADRILNDPRFSVLPATDRAKLIFNRANSMVEREYHSPTEDPRERSKLHSIVSCDAMPEGIEEDEETAASIRDLEGLIDITFATSTEQVRAGIRKCAEAERLSTPEERKLSEAYADLNMRLGWRRYFELETEEQAAALGIRA